MPKGKLQSQKADGGRTLRALFVGNSFTARNNLPGLIAALAEADGRTLEHRLISAGGASLRRHWNAGEVLSEVQAGRYDAVVLQEQSTLPVKNAARMAENVRLFQESIRSAGARMVLYMTWARRGAPEAQEVITDAYLKIAKELKAEVIPAGIAWQLLLADPDPPVLHDRDGSHPTLAGSYLAACTAYEVLFGRRALVAKAAVEGITPVEASRLQRAASGAIRVARDVNQMRDRPIRKRASSAG